MHRVEGMVECFDCLFERYSRVIPVGVVSVLRHDDAALLLQLLQLWSESRTFKRMSLAPAGSVITAISDRFESEEITQP